MRRIVLYITASLDGFIAEPGGGMSWLETAQSVETDFGYADFYARIDAMLMGARTYEFLLGAAETFPHADRDVYVFTSRDLPVAAPSVILVREDPSSFSARLKATHGGDIWLVGGGELNRTLWDAGLVDEVRLFVQPVVLGGGTELLPAPHARRDMVLLGVREWPLGIVELRYRTGNES